jgi:Zn-dependent M28 family amino/carboxypeptidase
LVDKQAIKRDVEKLSSFRTRYSGTSENQEAVLFVSSRLNELGYEVQSDCFSSGVCNIVADKKGFLESDDVIIVMAHVDSVMATFAGADDNASGTAVLMEMARLISSYPNKHTVRFLVTNGEEKGLLGSKHYVSKLLEQNKIKNVSLVINMDMVGYNFDQIVELETNSEFESMARWYADLAGSYTKLKTKITLGAWGSDHVPFLNHGVPSILTIENWETRTPCYHLKCDKPDTLNYDYAAEIGRLNLAAVLSKDAKE